jgi:Fur family peroxide stress response transcriptional regulator
MEEIPTLSKTTLYNTLNLFTERGIINMLNLEENESRYDADISLHAHSNVHIAVKSMIFISK